MLASGLGAIEELLPGITEELLEAGARPCKSLREIRLVISGHELCRDAPGADVLLASRPLIEGHIRRRVLALGNVTVLERCDAAELLTTSDRQARERRADPAARPGGGRGGVRGRPHGRRQRALGAHPGAAGGNGLSATGGGAAADRAALREPQGAPAARRAPRRQDHRDRRPPGASTRPDADRAGGPLDPDRLPAMAPSTIPRPRAGISRVHRVGRAGRRAHRDPRGRAAERDRHARLPCQPAPWLRPPERFPDGLLAVGDAISSFNPLYGQGMSVAALEAIELRRCLERGDRRLARRFFRAAGKIVGPAWDMAVGGDLALPRSRATVH